ncbi:MAG TPA: PHP domain-containing protein, partial [Casimicrobiaceae bacterium]|nr:PHP domain-containing protein [Casimicrobiaceae bacterium]
MLAYDLHCHSTRSDGLLSPADVVRRAAERGVDVVALTDHDEVAGLDEAQSAARDAGIGFVEGSELS